MPRLSNLSDINEQFKNIKLHHPLASRVGILLGADIKNAGTKSRGLAGDLQMGLTKKQELAKEETLGDLINKALNPTKKGSIMAQLHNGSEQNVNKLKNSHRIGHNGPKKPGPPPPPGRS